MSSALKLDLTFCNFKKDSVASRFKSRPLLEAKVLVAAAVFMFGNIVGIVVHVLQNIGSARIFACRLFCRIKTNHTWMPIRLLCLRTTHPSDLKDAGHIYYRTKNIVRELCVSGSWNKPTIKQTGPVLTVLRVLLQCFYKCYPVSVSFWKVHRRKRHLKIIKKTWRTYCKHTV